MKISLGRQVQVVAEVQYTFLSLGLNSTQLMNKQQSTGSRNQNGHWPLQDSSVYQWNVTPVSHQKESIRPCQFQECQTHRDLWLKCVNCGTTEVAMIGSKILLALNNQKYSRDQLELSTTVTASGPVFQTQRSLSKDKNQTLKKDLL